MYTRDFGLLADKRDADANFTNCELYRHGMNVRGLLADPRIREFVDWVANKDPDFNAAPTKEQN